jgi:predicted Rossmann fold nucleotide-binding protein DprA/Smf involved in DNA uptake
LAASAVAGKYRTGIKEGRLTLVSACDPNASFNVGNAMGRNKYIYALADRALVVSCSLGTGGTWAGAVEALERIKDVPVFVPIESIIPEGNQQLLKRGAKPLPAIPAGLLKGQLRELLSAGTPEFGAIETAIETGKNPQQSALLEIEAAVTDVEVTHSLTSDIAVNRSPLNSGSEIVAAKTGVEVPTSKETDVASNGTSQDAIAREKTPAVQFPPKDIYEAVLPLILSHLEQPLDDKSIAEVLDVQIGQMRLWLKRAVAEGKAIKTKNPVAYIANHKGALLSLLDENI